MGHLTARIAATRADRLRLTAIGVIPIKIDYAYLFTADGEAMEDQIEKEVLNSFGGPEAMEACVEEQTTGQRGMTAADMMKHLNSLTVRSLR